MEQNKNAVSKAYDATQKERYTIIAILQEIKQLFEQKIGYTEYI